MSLDIALLIAMVAMYTVGVYLLLERSVTRMIFGVILLANATNLLLFLTAGKPGLAPLTTEGAEPVDYTDPLPQAFILTAIVIGMATTAFMLALLYRSWSLARADVVADDHEDVSLREVDVEADDEVFDLDDAGDTDFEPEHLPGDEESPTPEDQEIALDEEELK
ncbi:Na(+)/H(+) antiporter subunit C [Gulosibacter hominis]|uniref:Na(+)/H(+) antiporter subunit C n=1 Tax=Gulosibacter hominis TaxID=2770504 RepID=UPI001918D2C0|nr:Na(+)/H(+) antiporter subunit C [Gulosibacter hominis]